MEQLPRHEKLDIDDINFDVVAARLADFLPAVSPSADELRKAVDLFALIEWYGKELNQKAPGDTLTELFGDSWHEKGEYI